jgi:hypothetical protein
MTTTPLDFVLLSLKKHIESDLTIKMSDVEFYTKVAKPLNDMLIAKAISFGIKLQSGDVYFDDKKYNFYHEQFLEETNF